MKKLIFIAISISTILLGCKKDKFTFEGKWTINYHWTSSAVGSFISTIKSSGKFDYSEDAVSQVDEGPWTSNGDSLIFTFTKNGSAIYRGIKTGDNTISGKIVFWGVDSGTFTGTR